MILSFFAIVIFAAMLIYESLSGRSMTAPLVSFGFLFLGIVLMLDPVWLALVLFWAIRITWRMRRGWWAFLPALAGVVIISAHLAGWKFYGAPRMYDNRPLFENSLTLDHLEMPNVMVASDGSRHPLNGVRWEDKPEIVSREMLQMLASNMGGHVRFTPTSDTAYASGYVFEGRSRYSCGNSFYPTLFPRGLPSYRKQDAATALRDFIATQEIANSH